MAEEQLEMFEQIPKEEWYRKTVSRLKDYSSLKLALAGADSEDDQSKLDKKRKKVSRIELALSSLTRQERMIIELSYFTREKPLDLFIRRQVGMAHSCYYDTKDEIMRHIATVLNIL